MTTVNSPSKARQVKALLASHQCVQIESEWMDMMVYYYSASSDAI